MERLHERIARENRLLVAPLVGYPGARLTRTTLSENLHNAALHTRSIRALIEAWRMDLALPMMDLSVEAGALGLSVRFSDFESPTVLEHPVKQIEDLRRFRGRDILSDDRLQSFLQTIEALRHSQSALVGAYVVGPFTLSALMMGATEAATATIQRRALVSAAVDCSMEAIETYAKACVAAGAEVIVILEPSAVWLSSQAFEDFSGKWIRQLVSQLDAMSVLHICGNSTRILQAMCRTGVDGLSLDAAVDFPQAAEQVPQTTVLIGNIDPVRVMGSEKPEHVERAVRELKQGMARFGNFLLSTGCDLPYATPPENIDAFMRAGRGGTPQGQR